MWYRVKVLTNLKRQLNHLITRKLDQENVFRIWEVIAITQLAHHSMIFIPNEYTFGEDMFEINVVAGGSHYGVGKFARDDPGSTNWSKFCQEAESWLRLNYQFKYI